ncbi:MAG: type II toxin-antitoxin system VapC family toxin [Myxococcales bacterium]|nr:type II toxin-antitoxin system VapC family toxin [Myxococcales bacterium]
MIFVDTNVFLYAVGAEHPNRAPATALLADAIDRGDALYTSAEVLQELLHVYRYRGQLDRFDDAVALVDATVAAVWPVEPDDVRVARWLAAVHPTLQARDLLHLAVCRRHGATAMQTFDSELAAAFAG